MTESVHGAVGTPLAHESAHLHVRGEARYTDDLPEPQGLLHAAIGASSQAHARIRKLDLDPVQLAPGVVEVLTASDIPGLNDYSAGRNDDPILAGEEVQYVGHSIFAVAAATVEQARRAVRMARINYQPLPAILDIDSALANNAHVLPSQRLTRGDPDGAIDRATHRLQGRLDIGGQDQFYLEGQIAMAIPQEDGAMQVYSSTQHPGEVQHLVARALAQPDHAVTVECRRMGGGFGGKETQPALIACIAALLATKTGRPVKLRLDRDADMIITGKRHDFRVDYRVGFDATGRIQGLDLMLAARCGMSADLSGPVADRAMFHADNAYYLDSVRIVSHRCKNTYRIEYCLPRLWGAARHDGDRTHHRPDRLRAGSRPAGRASGQPLRRGRAQYHTLRHDS